MNSVVLVGRLTKDPESRGQNDMAMCKFTLAVDKYKRGEVDYINCIAFNKVAERILSYVHKGDRLGVKGKISTGSYVNKEGVTVYTTEVIADDIDFLQDRKAPEKKIEVEEETGSEPSEDYSDLPFPIDE